MSTVLGDLLVKYKADVGDLTGKVKSVKSELSSVSQTAEQSGKSLKKTGEGATEAQGGFKRLLGSVGAAAAGFAAFELAGKAVDFLKDQIGDVIKVTEAHQFVAAQTVQVLKSTKDVSGMTASSLNDLADALSQTTDFSHDTVQGGENLLLTFTNIGKGVFPQATNAILDVSQAMGQDLKSSAIQVGKALGDPLTGMTALQRIGVTFSSSEKEQIKTMMAHHDVIGAQKVILKELSTEFGGSATAAGKTFGGMLGIMKNTFEDLKIKIGTAVMPLLTQFGNWFIANGMPLLKNFTTLITGTLIPGFLQLVKIGQNVVEFFQKNEAAMTALKIVGIAVAGVMVGAFVAWAVAAGVAAIATLALIWPFLAVGAAAALVVAGIILVIKNWGAITTWLGNLWATVSGWIGERFSWLGGVAHVVTSAIGGFFSGLGDRIQLWLFAWRLAFSLAGAAFSQFGSFIHGIIDAVGGAFSGLGSRIQGIWDGIVGAIKGAINSIIGAINSFIGAINGIQIHIPSVGIGPIHTPAFDWGGLGIPTIPMLASGGYIVQTGLAMVHAGESVVPATTSAGYAGGSSRQPAHFHFEINGREFALATVDDIQAAADSHVRLKMGSRGRAA